MAQVNVIYVKNAAWHLHRGTIDDAKKIRDSAMHKVVEEGFQFGPQATRAQSRPSNFNSLPGREQWAIDKRLDILDWDGDVNS